MSRVMHGCGAGFVLLLVGYQRAVSAQVAGLSAYLRQTDAGDYTLDVRDNGEGSFSLLKNDLASPCVSS